MCEKGMDGKFVPMGQRQYRKWDDVPLKFREIDEKELIKAFEEAKFSADDK